MKPLISGIKRVLDQSDSTDDHESLSEDEKNDNNKQKNVEMEKPMTSEDYAVKLGLVPSDSLNGTIEVPEASNSLLLVPLNLGWRREMVHNAKDTRIRYYMPSGQRLSSVKEVNRALKTMNSSLTLDNFSFERKILGVNDNAKETVRKSIPRKTGSKKRRPASLNPQRKSLETIEISSKQPSHSADTTTRKSLPARIPKLSTSSEIKVQMSDVSPFLVPLNMGWRREVVHRSNSSRFDVYYHTPSGKKLRSLVEVERALKELQNKLTVENFSFKLNSLGIDDPIKEEIRNASGQNTSLTTSTEKVSKKNQRESLSTSPPPTKKATLTVTPEDKLTATPKVKLIRMSQVESTVTPKVQLTVTPKDKLTVTPKVKLIRMSQVESTVEPKAKSTVTQKAKSTSTSKAKTSIRRPITVKFTFPQKKLESTPSETKMSSVPALTKSPPADSTKKKNIPPPPKDIAAKMKMPPTPKSLSTVDCLCEPDTIIPETIYSKWDHDTTSGSTLTAQMCNPNYTLNSLVDDSQGNIDDYFQLDGLITIEELPTETDNFTTTSSPRRKLPPNGKYKSAAVLGAQKSKLEKISGKNVEDAWVVNTSTNSGNMIITP